MSVLTNDFSSTKGQSEVGVIDPGAPELSSAYNLYARGKKPLFRKLLNARQFPLHSSEAAKLPVPQKSPEWWSTCTVCGEPTVKVSETQFIKAKMERAVQHGTVMRRVYQDALAHHRVGDIESYGDALNRMLAEYAELEQDLASADPKAKIPVCDSHTEMNMVRRAKSTAVVGKMPQNHNVVASQQVDGERWIVTFRETVLDREVQVTTGIWESEPRRLTHDEYYVAICEKVENLTIRNRNHRAVLNRDFFSMGEPIGDWMKYVQFIWEPVEEYMGSFSSQDEALNKARWWATQMREEARDLEVDPASYVRGSGVKSGSCIRCEAPSKTRICNSCAGTAKRLPSAARVTSRA